MLLEEAFIALNWATLYMYYKCHWVYYPCHGFHPHIEGFHIQNTCVMWIYGFVCELTSFYVTAFIIILAAKCIVTRLAKKLET